MRRMERQRAVKLRERGIMLAHLEERCRMVGDRINRIRPDGEGALKAGERVLMPPQPHQCNTAHTKAVSEQWVEAHGLTQQIFCLMELLRVQIHQSKAIQRVEMARI